MHYIVQGVLQINRVDFQTSRQVKETAATTKSEMKQTHGQVG